MNRTGSRSALMLLTTLLCGLLAIPRAGAEVPVGVWPLQPVPEVVHRFDPPAQPWAPGHRGVDLAGTVAQGVRTALPGRIGFAGRIAGKGVVVVDHGDTRTTYEPVAAQVRVGDVVSAGDRVGLLEVAGSHCFPRACLHWGWIRGEEYLDPLLLVGAGPIRLYPPAGSSWWGSALIEVAVTPHLEAQHRASCRFERPRLGQARGWACW